MAELRVHIGRIQESAVWLGDNGHHEASVYFSILCMEEISKHHVMSGRSGVGVREEDISLDHAEKVAGFLDVHAPPTHEGAGSPGGAPGQEAASALCELKERAVYFGPGSGAASTLEGLLGAGSMEAVSGLLASAVGQAALSLPPQAAVGMAHQGAGSPHARASARADIARVMATVQGPLAGAPPGVGAGIPHCRLDSALRGLEWHLGDLAKAAHELHAAGHESASIFMAVIALEEGARYYLLSRCRREEKSVECGDLWDMRNHKKKLSEFFKDVDRALGEKNKGGEGGGYVVLDPHYYVKLNGVKELAAYFAHMDDETVTLEAILGDGVRNLAEYVNQNVQGIVSWMVVCDGDSRDPYRIHNRNPVHLERYERFCRFREDPENAECWDGWYCMVGLLKDLNDEVRNLNVKGCKTRIAAIREFGHIAK